MKRSVMAVVGTLVLCLSFSAGWGQGLSERDKVIVDALAQGASHGAIIESEGFCTIFTGFFDADVFKAFGGLFQDFSDPDACGNSFSRTNPDGTFDTDYIDDVSIFGGGIKRYSTQNLKGGNVTAIFGGSEIDLTTSQMAADGTVVDVFTMFGGTKFIIPSNWKVKSEAVALFGGFSDKRIHKQQPEEGADEKVLLIKGLVLFGGVEIKNY